MTTTPPASIDEYLAAVGSDDARASLSALRALIHDEVPEAVECISYGMPAFKLDKPFFWFAAFKNHCSIFGQPVAAFAEELKAYKTSKGTIQFPHDRPLPESLVRAMVQAQLLDQAAKKGEKPRS